MPLLETQPDAAASIYANSMFELMNKRGGQQAVEAALGELEEFVELARSDAKFGEFISSRIISAEKRSHALETIFKGKLSTPVLNFVLVLNRKGRLGEITGVVAALDHLVQNAFGRIEVDVYTASPINDEDKAALTAKLKTALGREPVIHPYVDGRMIGGIRMQIGDQLIDGSVATSLRKLTEQLTTNGSAIIRAASDRIIDAGHVNGKPH